LIQARRAVVPMVHRLAALWPVALLFAGCAPQAKPPRPVLWAWDRPEDLRFAGDSADVAALAGFVEIAGAGLRVRGRRFPLQLSPGVVPIAVVHVEIDRRVAPVPTPALRRALAAAVLDLARRPGYSGVQLDFEVRQSQRALLLDLLADLRAGLPRGSFLSMTALASWCQGETWLDKAPVDEIVPMLFRMGPRGGALVTQLAAEGGFRNPRCSTAQGIATDTPMRPLPDARRVYIFAPRSWTGPDFRRAYKGLVP
jgi:hypothetical protein